jgi:hypothetical protein
MPLGEPARRGHIGDRRLPFVLPAGDDVALTLLMSLKVAVDQDIVTGKRFFYIMRYNALQTHRVDLQHG